MNFRKWGSGGFFDFKHVYGIYLVGATSAEKVNGPKDRRGNIGGQGRC